VRELEEHIDAFEAQLPPLKSFILPGGSPLAAALHLARCVCRRAERRTVTLLAQDPAVGELPVVVLNRLSDLLFVMARLANARAGIPDTPWHPAKG
jgi:cob(I)alamin adenosyltransferase